MSLTAVASAGGGGAAAGQVRRMTTRVVQLQVIHRHGDRTPLANLLTGTVEEGKETLRMQQLAVPTDQIAALTKQFPVQRHPAASPTYLDSKSGVTGKLTTIGLAQTRHLGNDLRKKYEPLLGNINSVQHVRVFCSNFLRTQLSVQSMMSGFFDGHSLAKAGIPVVVEDPNRALIAAYEHVPDLRREADAMLDTQFVQEVESKDVDACKGRDLMIAHYPFLRHRGFRWMEGADYLMCAKSHGVPVPSELQRYAHPIVRHTLWRFCHLFETPRILALSVGNLLRTIAGRAAELVENPQAATPRLCVYSGHDVTLVPIVHALTGRTFHELWNEWPPYASSIRIELLQDAQGDYSVAIRHAFHEPIPGVGFTPDQPLWHGSLAAFREFAATYYTERSPAQANRSKASQALMADQ